MVQLKKKHENDPVLFVGISSGNTKAAVDGYSRVTKIDWPVYVDQDRSFEKQFGFTISLKNIKQHRAVAPDGSVGPFNENDTLGRLLPKAKWKIQPEEIPESLKKTWRQVEFGQYAQAAMLLKQAMNASDPKVKAAASKLDEIVKADAVQALTNAKTKVDAGDKWGGFKGYSNVAERFKGMPCAATAQGEMSKLQSDAKVQREVQAKTMLEKIKVLKASNKPADQEQAKLGLQALAQRFGDTDAGKAGAE